MPLAVRLTECLQFFSTAEAAIMLYPTCRTTNPPKECAIMISMRRGALWPKSAGTYITRTCTPFAIPFAYAQDGKASLG